LIASVGSTRPDLSPEVYARHERHLQIASANPVREVGTMKGIDADAARDVGAYARMMMAMLYDFHEITWRAERKAALAAGSKPEDGPYAQDLFVSEGGQTLAAMIWARGKITHSDTLFHSSGWAPVGPAFRLSDVAQWEPTVHRILTAGGDWVERAQLMVVAWVWADVSGLEPKPAAPGKKKDPKNKRAEYVARLQGQRLVDTALTARDYLLAGSWLTSPGQPVAAGEAGSSKSG
jgi:hypothetical protein